MERNKFISSQWFREFVLLVCVKLSVSPFESNQKVYDKKDIHEREQNIEEQNTHF